MVTGLLPRDSDLGQAGALGLTTVGIVPFLHGFSTSLGFDFPEEVSIITLSSLSGVLASVVTEKCL